MNRLSSFFRRNSSTIALVIIFVAFALILYLQSLATARLQDQIRGQQQIIGQISGVTDQINRSSKQRTIQIDNLNKHLDCIVLFFSQQDRTNKSIKDIETCQLQTTSTGVLSAPYQATSLQGGAVSQPSPSSPASSPQPQMTITPAPKQTPVQQTANPLSDFLKGLIRLQG